MKTLEERIERLERFAALQPLLWDRTADPFGVGDVVKPKHERFKGIHLTIRASFMMAEGLIFKCTSTENDDEHLFRQTELTLLMKAKP